ncbi:hypothetical protein N7470_001660 [Penicillium chermesinum]|nr:hypothetical protein N7470_001660 [Penicillium chermesinum]
MGVGDYIHSKEMGQPRATPDLGPSQHQVRAAQPKPDVSGPQPIGPDGNGVPAQQGFNEPRTIPNHRPLIPSSNGMYRDRDAFDTDVEGIDDSTIAGTSVLGHDEAQLQVPTNQHVPESETSPKPSFLPRPSRSRRGRPSWFEGLGDKAMKKAGFDSDDADDTSSHATSLNAADNEKTQPPRGSWYLSHKNRAAEEPLSKRLRKFLVLESFEHIDAGNKPSATLNPIPEPQPRKLGHMLPPGPARKVTIPPNISATPRTRFSPPKPSLLEQLDISPTRQPSSEAQSQAGRTLSIDAFHEHDDSEEEEEEGPGMDETLRISSRPESNHSMNAFGISHLSDIGHGDREMSQDPFISRDSSTRGRRNTVIHTKKRTFEADYPPQVIYEKSFSELQAEPFDKTPTPAPSPAQSPSLPPEPSVVPSFTTPDDAVSQLLRLEGQERETFLSHMSVDEWEDCGDHLIERFTRLLTEMKTLRRARRRTAAVFEAELKRRHEKFENESSELAVKLDEMRTGGAEMLRGRRGE